MVQGILLGMAVAAPTPVPGGTPQAGAGRDHWWEQVELHGSCRTAELSWGGKNVLLP